MSTDFDSIGDATAAPTCMSTTRSLQLAFQRGLGGGQASISIGGRCHFATTPDIPGLGGAAAAWRKTRDAEL